MHSLIKHGSYRRAHSSCQVVTFTFHVKAVDQPYKWALSVLSVSISNRRYFSKKHKFGASIRSTLDTPKQCKLEKYFKTNTSLNVIYGRIHKVSVLNKKPMPLKTTVLMLIEY